MWSAALSSRYDIAVVGSGFAGSLMAMIAHKLGHRVVLLERGTHPRMMIGESSTPLSNLLLEELATRYDLPSLLPLCKWGSWRKTYPQIACGLKRGFTFYHHVAGQPASSIRRRENQLLVAASPHDEIGDTHWYRADFDHFLVQEAERQGIDYLDHADLSEWTETAGEIRLGGVRNGERLAIAARFVIDATGPRGFLHRALHLGERPLPNFPATQAIYTHFSGVSCTESLSEAPYPIDDAAVHHIFDGGWVWALRFSNGTTSAGLAATNTLMARLGEQDPQRMWGALLQQFPALKAQFAETQSVQLFRHIQRLSFRSASMAGENWALLPSAAGFVDPLLSNGFPLTLLGIARLAKILEHDWGKPNLEAQLDTYAVQSDEELLATARLIAALYENMANFPVFSALSLLYFAAASYSETARRLKKPELAPGFLLCHHPEFGPAAKRLLDRAAKGISSGESDAFVRDIYRVIEPFDVAGLTRAERNNWYPVDAEDLFRGAQKVHATREDIAQMLDRCGFHAATSSL